jgi:hypothetical protein
MYAILHRLLFALDTARKIQSTDEEIYMYIVLIVVMEPS